MTARRTWISSSGHRGFAVGGCAGGGPIRRTSGWSIRNASSTRRAPGKKAKRYADRFSEKPAGADRIGGKRASGGWKRILSSRPRPEPHRQTGTGRAISSTHGGVSAKGGELNREVQEKQKDVLDGFRDKIELIVAKVAKRLGLAGRRRQE